MTGLQEDVVITAGGMSHPAVTIRETEDYKVVYYDDMLVMCSLNNVAKSILLRFDKDN